MTDVPALPARKPTVSPEVPLSAPFVEGESCIKDHRMDYRDEGCEGLTFRVSANGHKSWTVTYRLHGERVRETLGPFNKETLNLAEARRRAKIKRGLAADGVDPRASKREQKAERLQAGADANDQRRRLAVLADPTMIWSSEAAAASLPDPALGSQFEWVAAEFLIRYARREQKSWRETDRVIAKHLLPVWSGRQLAAIGRKDVRAVLDGLVDDNKPILANRVLAYTRKAFNWAIDREIGALDKDAANPARMKRPGKERARERELSADEIRAIWPALDKIPEPFGTFIKLCLVTGQRRDEVAGMRWDQIVTTRVRRPGDAAGEDEVDVWELPSSSTKAKRRHVVPLSPLAIKVLGEVKRVSGRQHVFTKRSDRPISGFSKIKDRLDEIVATARAAAGAPPLENWTIHDLRRTCGTGLARLEVEPHIVGRVFNHAATTVTDKHYNRHLYLREKRAALEAWGRELERILEPLAAAADQPAAA
jgi:integrase